MHINPDISALLNRFFHGHDKRVIPGIDLSLVRMFKLLDALGNPQEKLPPVIHIAGTNGKGSTLAFLRAIYAVSGYRVHAYTSPHLVKFNERIAIGGRDISDAQLADVLQQVSVAAEEIPITFFEATTAAALLAFAQSPADVLLLETGLGGRLDATNVVEQPLASVITPIDYDHMEFLGDDLASIAGEKAEIIKPSVPCFVGAQLPAALSALQAVADEKNAPLLAHGRDWHYSASLGGIAVDGGNQHWQLPLPSLLGVHQYHNAALASVVAHSLPALPVTMAHIIAGIETARWPARLQRLQVGPLVDAWGTRGPVLLDGGHNPHAAHALAQWLKAQSQPVTLVCGMMQRKDAQGFLAPLAAYVARCITVPIPGNDAYAPKALQAMAMAAGMRCVEACKSLDDLPAVLQGDAPGIVLIAGSLFLAGEVLKNHS